MPDYEQLCVLIVTFFPEEKTLQNIRRMEECWPELQIVVVDNTIPSGQASEPKLFQELSFHHPKVHTIRNQANFGIATAMNQGAEYAIRQGLRWMVTLDQDTELDPDYFSELDNVLKTRASDVPTAVIGVNYHNLVTGKPGEPILNSGRCHEVRDVITSGSLVSLDAYRSIGGFLDKLFIDMVDTEYCFRARKAGFAILFISRPLMRHALGLKETVCWLGRSFTFSTHPPFRHYFIFRNTIFMVKEYFWSDFSWSLKMICKYLPKVFIKAMLGRTRQESIGRIVCGIRDGLLSDFGHNPQVARVKK